MAPRSAPDYQGALLASQPPGAAWSRDPLSAQGRYWGAHADGLARIDAAAEGLVAEANPQFANQMLPEWQELLGVPEPGTDTGTLTTAQIKAQVVAKDIAIGGQTAPYFIGIAAALGFTITIQKFRPARIGVARCGDPLYGLDWAFAWQVNVSGAPAGFVPPATIQGADAMPTNALEIFLHKFEPGMGALIVNYEGL
jgi:uncharacterized protein YmfQ (DUF2313 family)